MGTWMILSMRTSVAASATSDCALVRLHVECPDAAVYVHEEWKACVLLGVVCGLST